jgi:hypothetical protein
MKSGSLGVDQDGGLALESLDVRFERWPVMEPLPHVTKLLELFVSFLLQHIAAILGGEHLVMG